MTNGQNSNSGNREIPVKVFSEFSVSADELRHQRISEKAHEIYECRGCCHGRDVDDWLEAERILLSELASLAPGNFKAPRPRGPRAKKQ